MKNFPKELPADLGYWPAFWMLPQDSVYGTWAASGDNKGGDSTTIEGTLRYDGQ